MGEGDEDVGRASAQRARNGGVGIGRDGGHQAGGEDVQESGGAVGGADEPGARDREIPGGAVQGEGGALVAEEVAEQGQDEGLNRVMQARVGRPSIRHYGDAQAGGGLGQGWWN